MRSIPEIQIQTKILQEQLRQMKAKHQDYTEEFQQGIGKLRAICWVLGTNDDAAPTLAYSNKELARMELLHGCF